MHVGDTVAQHHRGDRGAVGLYRRLRLLGEATLHRYGVEHHVSRHAGDAANVKARADRVQVGYRMPDTGSELHQRHARQRAQRQMHEAPCR